jgi:uncharacterized Tic20 family protein
MGFIMAETLHLIGVVVAIMSATMGPVVVWISKVNSRLTRIETLLEERHAQTHRAG